MAVYRCGLYPCKWKTNGFPCSFTDDNVPTGKVDIDYVKYVRNLKCKKEAGDIFKSLYIDAEEQ